MATQTTKQTTKAYCGICHFGEMVEDALTPCRVCGITVWSADDPASQAFVTPASDQLDYVRAALRARRDSAPAGDRAWYDARISLLVEG